MEPNQVERVAMALLRSKIDRNARGYEHLPETFDVPFAQDYYDANVVIEAISAMPDSYTLGWNAAIEAAKDAMENLSFMTDVSDLIGMTKQQMSERTCHEGALAITALKKDTGNLAPTAPDSV